MSCHKHTCGGYVTVVDLGLDDATEELLDFERSVWNRQLESGICYIKVSVSKHAVLVVYLLDEVTKERMEEYAKVIKMFTRSERVAMGFSGQASSPILQIFLTVE